jgi:cytosine/uracil/thiamine/allantoin permease
MNASKLNNKKETEDLIKEVIIKKPSKDLKRGVMKSILVNNVNIHSDYQPQKRFALIILVCFLLIFVSFLYNFEIKLNSIKDIIQINSITLISIIVFLFFVWLSTFTKNYLKL